MQIKWEIGIVIDNEITGCKRNYNEIDNNWLEESRLFQNYVQLVGRYKFILI